MLGLIAFLVAAPALALLQQAALLGTAGLLSQAASFAETVLLPRLPIDPVYGGAGLRVLGGIKPCGLALSGELGGVLHQVAPGLFGAPHAAAPGVLVSALLAPGATVSARAISAVLAATVLIVAVRWLGRRLSARWIGPASILAQAYLLLDLARECAFSLRELEATGLPFALAALSPVDAEGQRELWTRQLDHLSDDTVGLACGAATVVLCLGSVWLVEAAARLVRYLARRRRFGLSRPGWRALPRVQVRAGTMQLARLTAGSFVAATIVVSPLGAVADGQPATADTFSPAEAVAGDEAVVAASVAPPEDALARASGPTSVADPRDVAPARTASARSVSAGARSAGSVVAVQGSGYRFSLTVDGAPMVVRGMGYNPWYAGLPVEERRARYDRDFAAMQEIGVNALEGWFQDQFDEVTLDAAQRHGLRVIVPFELNQDYDYADPAIRERFRGEVGDWVRRYRKHPAVLMWGPGNEVMHRLIFPTAVKGQQDASAEARADAYAAFYVELMDMIHELDPNHPVVYRDAEDLYFARFRQAFQRDGKPRPWFIYGMNVYTQRLAEDIERWPSHAVDAPLLISEFSPGGVGPVERPQSFGWYWSVIRARPEMVLGGVVYTWSTQGPEDLDRVFGLTDPDGKPVDGSVAALGRLFLGDQARGRPR
jgi:hypothetical protein